MFYLAMYQDQPGGIPWWVWLLVALFVILVGVIWTLYEEGQAKSSVPEPAEVAPTTPPPPEPAAVTSAPEPIPAAVPPEPEPAPVEAAPPPAKDDLKKVSGIGPKIMRILNDHGIYTFEQLAEADVDFLDRLVDEQKWYMADSRTWPDQARRLAAEKKDKA